MRCFITRLKISNSLWLVAALLLMLSACGFAETPTPQAIPPTVAPATATVATATPTAEIVTEAEPSPDPPTAVPATATPTPCVPHQPAGWVSYQVRRGDNLFRLSLNGGVSLETLMQANCRDSDIIYVGELLYVPPGSVVTIFVPQPAVNQQPPVASPAGIEGASEQPAPLPCDEEAGDDCFDLLPTVPPVSTEDSSPEAPVVITVIVTVVVTATPVP